MIISLNEYVSNITLGQHHLEMVIKSLSKFLDKRKLKYELTNDYKYNAHVLKTSISVYCGEEEIKKMKLDLNKEIQPIDWDIHEIAKEWFERNKYPIESYLDKINLIKYNFILSHRLFWQIKFGKIEMIITLFLKEIRVKRIIPNRFIFHSSHKDFRKTILKEGLIPKKNTTHKWEEYLNYPPAIFAINSNSMDDFWKKPSQGYDVWKIDTKNLPNNWWVDLNLYSLVPSAIMTFEPIPKKYIKLYSLA